MSKELSRREFLNLSVLTLGSVVINSCAPKKFTPTLMPTPEPQPTEYQPNPLTPEEIKNNIKSLPESPYKDFILQYAGFLIADPYPTEIKIGNTTISVFPPTVDNYLTKEEKDFSITGSGGIKGNSSKKLKVPSDKDFFLPMPFIYPEEEVVEKGGIMHLKKDSELYTGIVPEFALFQPIYTGDNPRIINFLMDLKKFISIKEVASLAFTIGYIALSIEEMNKNNTDFYLNLLDDTKIEMATTAFRKILRTNGRFLWTVDAAGLLIATKALQNDPVLSASIYQFPDFQSSFTKILGKDFNANNEIFRNLVEFALDKNNRDDFKHWGIAGDPDKMSIE